MINVFEHPEFNRHQEIHFYNDEYTGLKAIIAIHRLVKGRSGGGCRFHPYAGSEEALMDVLRLSRAMTYKFALADIPIGGGKAVIIGNPKTLKSEKLLKVFGEKIAELNGKYIAGPDIDTNEADMTILKKQTSHVAGASDSGGDTAPMTGYGVFKAITAAWQYYSEGRSLENVHVAIQGFGGVGYHLAKNLDAAGAQITVADVSKAAEVRAKELGFKVVDAMDILSQEVDILAPCALGGVLNATTIPKIKASVICGGANNQLKDEKLIDELWERNILYVPDFISSAGGAIYGAGQLSGKSKEELHDQVERIYYTTLQVLQKAEQEGINVLSAAYAMAEERLKKRNH